MPPALSAAPQPRLSFIDALKATASQLIILHHLAFYGPMSDVAGELAPALVSWFSQQARIAVQVFLVIGGFLAARALAPNGVLKDISPLALLKKRYLKLIVPFLAALLISIVCAAIARRLMTHDSIPAIPSLMQILVHVLLLHTVLGFDSLSAGVWYIAIDFQLFFLLLGVLQLAHFLGSGQRGQQLLGAWLVGILMLASLFHFNRDAEWDSWGLYFFGAYALGAFAYWLANGRTAWLAGLAGASVVLALWIDFRPRLAIALCTALALAAAQSGDFLSRFPQGVVFRQCASYLGKISYSVFLIHFPVILLINALFTRLAPSSPGLNALGLLVAWAASNLAGTVFYTYVEDRSQAAASSAK